MLSALLLAATVPVVVLTSDRAARMSPRQLERLLLAGFPHGPIVRVDQPPAVPRPVKNASPFRQPLNGIIFHERPRAAGGVFCSARRIYASFSTLDGGVRDAPAATMGSTWRRLHSVTAAPLLGILDRPATDAACAAASVTGQLPPRDPAQGQEAVEQWLALRREVAAGRSAVPLSCTDDERTPSRSCDAVGELAAIPPGALLGVDLPSAVRGPTTQLIFADAQHFWVVDLADGQAVAAVEVRRTRPPPF